MSGIVNIVRGSSRDGRSTWVHIYCSENPITDVDDAAEFLLATLQINRQRFDEYWVHRKLRQFAR